MSGTLVSLFSGCGGMDLGFKESGFRITYACDNDPACVEVYARNVGKEVRYRDVRTDAFRQDIDAIGEADIVLGGFPCQGFSKAGPKNEHDPRNTLYEEMRYAVARMRPVAFLAENVDGIRQNFGGRYIHRIEAGFRALGYRVEHRVLDAASYGLAQHRRRVFFVGVQSGAPPFHWPTPTHAARERNGEFKAEPFLCPMFATTEKTQSLQPTVAICDAIGDLLELRGNAPDHVVTNAWPKKYDAIFAAIGQGQKLCNVRHASTSVYTWDIPEVFGCVSARQRMILETIARNRRKKEYGRIPNGNPLPRDEIELLSGLSGIAEELCDLTLRGYLKRMGDRFDLKGAMFCSGLFKRPRWDEPSPTVLTVHHNPRYFLHPLRPRPFSLRECARLQGFPDDFHFLGSGSHVDLISAYRMVGNAVPPPLGIRFGAAFSAFFADNRLPSLTRVE